MIAFIIGAITLVVFFIWYIRDYGFKPAAFGWSIMMGLVGVLVGGLIMIIGNVSYAPDHDNSYIEMGERTELVAMRDNFGIEGAHFLFSGYMNSDIKYLYIEEDEVMGMQTKSLSPSVCYIKYIEDGDTPHIEAWTWNHNNAILRWLFCLEAQRYTIYLPEGSVVQQVYEVDLE